MATGWFRYVPHSRVEAYTSLGWAEADRFGGTHHGHYSILMVWRGEGEPIEPETDGHADPLAPVQEHRDSQPD